MCVEVSTETYELLLKLKKILNLSNESEIIKYVIIKFLDSLK